MSKIVNLSLIIFLFCFFVSISYAVDLIVENESGEPGDTVEVDIDIQTYTGEEIWSFGLQFNYNKTNLLMTNDDNELKCDLTQAFIVNSNDPGDNGIVIIGAYTTGDPISENTSGCILRIVINVRNDATG